MWVSFKVSPETGKLPFGLLVISHGQSSNNSIEPQIVMRCQCAVPNNIHTPSPHRDNWNSKGVGAV